jgi:hypothetical protein
MTDYLHLLLNFHLFPAAMQFPIAATGHDKLCSANRADISFANLISHVFNYLLFIFPNEVLNAQPGLYCYWLSGDDECLPYFSLSCFFKILPI